MSLLAGKCANPRDPRPGVTTNFCVYDKNHDGNCSWADTADVRFEKIFNGPGSRPLVDLCPECDNPPPEGGGTNHRDPRKIAWSAWVADSDVAGVPSRQIHVGKADGSHVAESDAAWIRERLRGN